MNKDPSCILHCPCGGAHFSTVFQYIAPPQGEIGFKFVTAGRYRREVLCCGLCGHFISQHQMDNASLYTGDYVDANYGDDNGIRRAFGRIIALDPVKSDNVGRVQRILEFAGHHLKRSTDHLPSILDVGSGLCVFLHRMKAAGWHCTAIDPDPRAVKHAQEVVGVEAVCGDFIALEELGYFDVVTFNKVLEHVKDPVVMLTKAKNHVKPDGFIYVELPDGEAAAADGQDREEFFIDHPHIFSSASLAILAKRSGFTLQVLERLREPSTKYTLRAFLVPT